MHPLCLAALLVAGSGALLLPLTVGALRRRRFGRATLALGGAGALLLTAAAVAALGIGAGAYRALLREDLAATIAVEPVGPERLVAEFHFPSGERRRFELAGDQIQIDAYVLKWKPLANLLGLHTDYRLDRVSGRYSRLDRERVGARTVFALDPTRGVDPPVLRRALPFLSLLVDAEYGSASFVPIDQPSVLELRVGTGGLLLRARPSPP